MFLFLKKHRRKNPTIETIQSLDLVVSVIEASFQATMHDIFFSMLRFNSNNDKREKKINIPFGRSYSTSSFSCNFSLFVCLQLNFFCSFIVNMINDRSYNQNKPKKQNKSN